MAAKHKRKRRLIDQKQQVRFAIELSLYTMLFPFIAIIVAVGDYSATWLTGGDVGAIHPLLREVLVFCSSHWWKVFPAMAVVAYVSVWFSHKLFGPVYRFESVLQQKRDDPSRPVNCRLRRGDYFQDFAQLFEAFLNKDQPLAEAGQTEKEALDPEKVATSD